MAEWKVSFRDRKTGQVTTMKVEAVNESNAIEIGSFFERSYGSLITGKSKNAPVKA